jgi:integrase
MSNNSNWKGKLQEIINVHNHRHGARPKSVSHNTESARAHALFRCFTLLRTLGFHADPSHLNGKHVQLLVRYWTADPAIAALCRNKGVPMLAAQLSAAYIQQQLSILRVFCTWIGKPGMVLAPERYVSDPALVARCYTARHDKGWAGNGVNVDDALAAVARIDGYVAVQLNLMLQFGLRRKEAVMFCPHAAVVPAHAVPATHPVADRYLVFLKVRRGTKGGRLRFTAVRTEAQQHALDVARTLARYPDSHLGRPGLTLKQSLDRFGNVLRKAGITKAKLGVTSHGLRHQFAGDLFVDIAEVPPPVRGGDPALEPEAIRAVYLEVAHQLGHGRPAISGAYLGSVANANAAGLAPHTGNKAD